MTKANTSHDPMLEGRVFLAGLALVFSAYLAALPLMGRALESVSDSSLVSVPFFVALFVSGFAFRKWSALPRPDWGMASSGLSLTAVSTLALVVAMAVSWEAGLASTELGAVPTAHGAPWAIALYLLFVPVQEYLARGVVLAGLLHYYSDRWALGICCLTSAAMFSLVHLYLSPVIAAAVFIPGLVWSYLYAQTRSLMPVTISHMVCGLFWTYLLGA